MTKNYPRVPAERVHAEVPAELSSGDLRAAATALEDLIDDVVPNLLSSPDRAVIADVSAWLRRTAKLVDPRDARDWGTVLAVREERETRFLNQRVAARYGVSEATARAASISRQHDRSKRRIVG